MSAVWFFSFSEDRRCSGDKDKAMNSRAAKAAKTGKFRKLPLRSAHSPSHSGIHHISRMFGDGARAQNAMAASSASARETAIKRNAVAL